MINNTDNFIQREISRKFLQPKLRWKKIGWSNLSKNLSARVLWQKSVQGSVNEDGCNLCPRATLNARRQCYLWHSRLADLGKRAGVTPGARFIQIPWRKCATPYIQGQACYCNRIFNRPAVISIHATNSWPWVLYGSEHELRHFELAINLSVTG